MRLSIIGFGVMGERLTRAALDFDPNIVELAGVWDPSGRQMERLSAELPNAPHLASAEAAVAEADCVYIASPPLTHLGHARASLNAGKAVFTEKPLGVDLADSRAFVQEAAGARAAVNFVFASSPAVGELKTWIADGAVGKAKSITVEADFAAWPREWQMDAVSWLAKRAEGGFTREVLSHFLFLTARLGGDMSLLDSQVEYPPGDMAETSVSAKMQAGSTPVSLRGGVGTIDEMESNLWLLEGDAGSIRLRNWSTAERLDDQGVWRTAPDTLPHTEARPLILKGQLHKLAAMTAGKAHDLATPAEALAVQEVIEAILSSQTP
jgi:predicted dehydrogenase